MAFISELPIMAIAMEAEEKHGIDTHMAIEVVLKNPKEVDEDDETFETDYDQVDEKDVMWVEFENQQIVFDTFDMVKHFLLEEAVKTGEGPEVVIDFVSRDGEEDEG
jgi:hypothetical protein